MSSVRPKVLVDRCHWTRPEDWERLACHVELVELEGEQPYTEERLIAALQGCQGLIKLGRRVPELTRRVFESASELKVVGLRSDRFGTGIDLAAAAEHGVKVVDCDNIASAPPVAEWVLALMLLCLRNGAAIYRQMMAGTETWANAGNEGFVNGELTGRKVGLIGCGHVGQRLIELLAPFRVELRVCDPYLPEARAAELGIVREGLDQVLEHAEILVVQVPHTPKTTKLIGTRELELLTRGSIFINCCRGKVVDQAALIRKLEAGELIAGLDVFDPEPLEKESPLRSLPNVFLSPHIAWHAPNRLHRYFMHMAQEFERFFNGEPLQFELTPRMVDIRHGRI
jgi:phosphoglycerate dehydrogenase-like enzyme